MYIKDSVIGFNLEEEITAKMTEDSRLSFEENIIGLYLLQPLKTEADTSLGYVCKTCEQSDVEINQIVYYKTSEMKRSFENEFKFGFIPHVKIYKNLEELKFEGFKDYKILHDILFELFMIEPEYVYSQLNLHKKGVGYFEKFQDMVGVLLSSYISNKSFIIKKIKEIYIYIKLKERGVYNLRQSQLDILQQAEREWDVLELKDKSLKSFSNRLFELQIPAQEFSKYIQLKGTYEGIYNKKFKGRTAKGDTKSKKRGM